jgi:hypothetical protein
MSSPSPTTTSTSTPTRIHTGTPASSPATVVLVDPTAPDGESSLAALLEDDTHVLVVVLLSGRASNALHEYAHHEQTSVSAAAWTYLEQVAMRIDRPGRIVGTIAATGPDAATELALVAAEHDVGRVVLPTSALRSDRRIARRLAQLAPVTIEMPPVDGRVDAPVPVGV